MANVGGLTSLLRLGKEGIAKWLNAARPYVNSDENMARLEKLVKDMPHTAEMYAPRALGYALNDPATQMRGLTPKQFLDLAYPLDTSDEFTQNTLAHYRDLTRSGNWQEPAPGIFQERYLASQRAKPYEGFSDAPFLTVQEDPMSWLVKGHEGRHRMNVSQDLYGTDTPSIVRIRPYGSGKLTRKLPSIVEPEVSELTGTRPWVDLSRTPRYARGGLNQIGGSV